MEGLIGEIVILVLAMFVGFEVITKVPPTLHTPLMSGSNAISGITVIGAMIVAGEGYSQAGAILGIVFPVPVCPMMWRWRKRSSGRMPKGTRSTTRRPISVVVPLSSIRQRQPLVRHQWDGGSRPSRCTPPIP